MGSSRQATIMPLAPEDAFRRAFDEYADALFRHAYFRVSNRERAADLAQDAFAKTWDYLRGGGEVRHWRSFLYRVLNNLIIDEYRRFKEESLDALLENETVDTGALLATGSRDETEHLLDERRELERIRKKIPELPEAYRVAITMRYIDGLSPKEIAPLLGVSENVVAVRVHRGVALLRKLYGTKPYS